jgi:carboxymethylenebutenolidase
MLVTTRIHYKATGGAQLEGELAEPSGSSKAPALVVVQEWHGVNDYMRSLVDRFAKEGFLAFAPDLFHGKVAKTTEEASRLMNELDKPRAVAEIGNAAAYLTGHARSNGKVGVTGFCLGGALTFAAVCNVPGLSAAVPFYGLSPIPLDWTKATCPIQAHFAKKDDWAKPSGAEEIKKTIEKIGKTTMELHVYDAGHAFMRDTDPGVYDKPSAIEAWARALAFLKKHLA